MPDATTEVTTATSATSNVEQRVQDSIRPNITPLWTHLLQRKPQLLKPASLPGGEINSLPPITPVDKAGTSMRILLHDTQVQFEKFSEHVVQVSNGVDSAKREIVATQKLFDRDHEKLLEELVDLGMSHMYLAICSLSHVVPHIACPHSDH